MYYTLWPELLKLIKERFMQEAEIGEDYFEHEENEQKWQRNYYLKNYDKNLISSYSPDEKEKEEFKFIASRKALNVNLFGEEIINIKDNDLGISSGEYIAKYYRKYPLLNIKNSNITLDNILYGKDEINIIRTQFLEWIVLGSKPIKESFMLRKNYIHKASSRVFAKQSELLATPYSTYAGEYNCMFSNFDALYVIKEFIAAYNMLRTYDSSELKKIKRLNIIECYWRPINYEMLDNYAGRIYVKNKRRATELEYIKYLLKPIDRLFREAFSIKTNILSIDVWQMLFIQQNCSEKQKWMKRFIV